METKQVYGNRMVQVASSVASRAAAVVVAALVALVAGLVSAQHAEAANSDGNCEYKEVCIYEHTNLNGHFSDYRYYHHNYDGHGWDTCGHVGCGQNDEVSSLDNWDPDWKVRFFVNKNYDGSYQTLVEYGRDNNANHNDAYSSHCWNDGTKPYQDNGTYWDPECKPENF